jgi:hypothetical protein
VANLVLDGTDGIVLGSETFRGKYPVEAAQTVLAICRQAEKCFDAHSYYNSVMDNMGYHSLDPRMDKVGSMGLCVFVFGWREALLWVQGRRRKRAGAWGVLWVGCVWVGGGGGGDLRAGRRVQGGADPPDMTDMWLAGLVRRRVLPATRRCLLHQGLVPPASHLLHVVITIVCILPSPP